MVQEQPAEQPQEEPRRRRRKTPSRRARQPASEGAQAQVPEAAATPPPAPAPSPPEEQVAQRPRRRRRKTPSHRARQPASEGAQAQVPEAAAPPLEVAPADQAAFAHPSEREFARILDFYGLRWVYEPRSFPLRWEGDHIHEMFTPDFHLPDLDLYVELTTLKQSLVTEKNRKLRRLRELYPETNIKLLYRRDYYRLLAKYGVGPLAEVEVRGIDRVLFTTYQIQQRVKDLAYQLSQDYAGHRPVLVGVLRGVLCFMADLMRHISLPVVVDFMAISPFAGGSRPGVRITKDLDTDISGEHVIMVEDIVDTGMTLNYLLQHLQRRNPASLAVCTLLDKRVRRIVDVPLKYVGFQIPDEFVVGYGLDYLEMYRNLPFIGGLHPDARQYLPPQDGG